MNINVMEKKDGIKIDFLWTSCYAHETETIFIENYKGEKSEVVGNAILKKLKEIEPIRY